MSKAMRNGLVRAAAAWALAAGAAWGGDGFGSARSGAFRLDARDGTRLAGGGAEAVVVSGRWEGSAAVARADGAVLAEAAAGEEKVVEWVPEGTGLHVLTHESGGVVLEAAFTVLGDDVVLHAGAVAGSETWEAGKVHLVTAAVTVGSGAALTIESGAVVKFMDGTGLAVADGGSCTAYGVVFTHAADDTVGGDTLMDGAASAPVMGAYTLTGNILEDEATEERYAAPVVLGGTLSYDVRLQGHRVYTAVGNITIASGVTVTIAPGAIIKMGSGLSVTVASGATLVAQGTRAEPIVCTSAKDDEHGGDTNGDGDATSPQPGDWYQIRVQGTAIMDHCSVLYASSAENYGGVEAYGGTVAFDNGEIAFMKYDSVNAHSSGTFTARNSVLREGSLGFGYYGSGRVKAFNCVFHGLTTAVRQSGKELVNCVFSECQAFTDQGGDGSTFRNCLFWNPAGYGAQSYSKAGSNGNVWANPLFVDADNGDFRVRAGSACIDAGDGTVAPETDYFGRPRMNDPNVADTGVANANGVCPDIGIYEMEGGNAASDVDLEAVRASASAEATVGGTLDVVWTVANVGTEKAAGPWRDVVSLVNEASGETVALGETVVGGGLAGKASKGCSGRFAVPAVPEGEWRVKVQVNAYRDVYEGGAVTNNAVLSAGMVRIAVAGLSPEEGASGTLVAGSATVVKFAVPEGAESRLVRVTVPAGVTVRFGTSFVPSEEVASDAAKSDGEDVLFAVPEGEETVYVAVENGGRVAAAWSVAFEAGRLAVGKVSPPSLPGKGTLTVEIEGAGFVRDSAVAFVRGAATVDPVAVRYVSPSKLVAEVDCRAFAAGATYDVRVTAGGASATLAKALSATAAAGKGKLWARLVVPGSVRQGRVVSSCFVEYGNEGTVDMPAPILQVSVRGDGTLGFADGKEGLSALQFVGAGEASSAGVLRPGSAHRIRFVLRAGAKNELRLHTAAAPKVLPPPWTDADEFAADLSAAATRTGLRGQNATEYGAVLALAEAMRSGGATSAIYGRVVDTTGAGIGGVAVQFTETGSSNSWRTVTLQDGRFSTPNLAAGTFEVAIAGRSTPEEVRLDGVQDVALADAAIDWRRNFAVSLVGADAGMVGVLAISESTGDEFAPVWTSDTSAVFRGLADGLYRVAAIGDGFERESTAYVRGGIGMDLVLDYTANGGCTYKLAGVTDTEGMALMLFLNGALQRIVPCEGATSGVLAQLPAGDYLVLAAKEGIDDAVVARVAIGAGKPASVVLDCAGHFTGEAVSSVRGLERDGEKGVPYRPNNDWEDDAEALKTLAERLLATSILPPSGAEDCEHNRADYQARKAEMQAYRLEYARFFAAYCHCKAANSREWGEIFKLGPRAAGLIAKLAWGPLGGSVVDGINALLMRYWAGEKDEDELYAAGMSIAADGFEAIGGVAGETGGGSLLTWLGWTKDALGAALDGWKLGDAKAMYAAAQESLKAAYDRFWVQTGAMQDKIDMGWFGPYSCHCGEENEPEAEELLPPVEMKTPSVPQSWDPNEMGGPDGVKMVEEGNTNRYVQAGREMEYSIYFENKADAAAAAQEVRVVNPLSEWLDWDSFEMGEVVFRNQVDMGLSGKVSGTSEAALEGNESGWKVKTTLAVSTNGVAEWYLRVVDESTADGWPVDPYAGFLPPNDAEGNGEGRLTYRIRVRDDAPIGTVISNSAVITFDYNAPIETDPAWWNIVEAVTNVVLEGVSAEGARSGDGTVEVVAGKPYGDLLPVPERTGWEFGGWWTGPDGTGEQVTAETVAGEGTLELFAKWVRAVFGELWLDVTHGNVVVSTNGVTAGYAPDGSAVEGMAQRYVLTGTSSVHSVRFAGGIFTNTWTNLVVDLDAKDAVAMLLEGASVEVTLEGDNFIASGEDCAGIRVDEESSLVLQGTGRLEAWGGAYGAGIGSGLDQKSGRVEVRGGTVEAQGGTFGAGIGGGLVSPGAEVVITGGSVKARGSRGSDIGAGYGEPQKREPTDGAGSEVHEVEVPLATDEVPVVIVVEWGDGRTYRYEGMGHEGDSSLWFWLPDGTYDFEADGDDYGAHVAGASAVAVFTDPGSEHFESPAVEEVSVTETGWKVGLNPAYRTTPFELWTATGLDGDAWAWERVDPEMYRFDAETGAVEWLGETKGVRVFRFSFRAKE